MSACIVICCLVVMLLGDALLGRRVSQRRYGSVSAMARLEPGEPCGCRDQDPLGRCSGLDLDGLDGLYEGLPQLEADGEGGEQR